MIKLCQRGLRQLLIVFEVVIIVNICWYHVFKVFRLIFVRKLTWPEHKTPLVVPGAIQVSVEVGQWQSDSFQPALQTQRPHSQVPWFAHIRPWYRSHEKLSHSQNCPDIVWKFKRCGFRIFVDSKNCRVIVFVTVYKDERRAANFL